MFQLPSVRLWYLVALAMATLTVCRIGAAERIHPLRVRVVADDVHLRWAPNATTTDNIIRHVSTLESWDVQDSEIGLDEHGSPIEWYSVVNTAKPVVTGWIAAKVTFAVPVREAAPSGTSGNGITLEVALISLLTSILMLFAARAEFRAKRLEEATQRRISERLPPQQMEDEAATPSNVADFRRRPSNVRERLGLPERDDFRSRRSG